MGWTISSVHGITTGLTSACAVVSYATSLHGSSSWLPSLDGFTGLGDLGEFKASSGIMTVVMIGILVCGCFPAVIAYKVLIKRYKDENGSRPPKFYPCLLGFGTLIAFHVIEGEALEGVDPFRVILVVWLAGMSLVEEAPFAVISGTLLAANDRYFYGCAIPLVWGLAVSLHGLTTVKKSSPKLPPWCELNHRLQFLGLSTAAGGIRRIMYLFYRGAAVTTCQVRTMQPVDGLVQAVMLLLWSGAVIYVQYKQGQQEKEGQQEEGGKQPQAFKPRNFSIPVRVDGDRAMDQELGVAYIRNAKGST